MTATTLPLPRTAASVPRLLRAALALVPFYLAGAVWAAADGIATLPDALLNGSRIDAPLVIVAAQVGGALAAARLPGRAGTAGAVLTLLACTLSLGASAFDGDVGHAGLSTVQVAYQLVIVALTVVTWLLAAARVRSPHARVERRARRR
jgi:hypothetical protein